MSFSIIVFEIIDLSTIEIIDIIANDNIISTIIIELDYLFTLSN